MQPQPTGQNNPLRRRQAFTLIELMISVAIISVAISVLLVAIGSVRDHSKSRLCASNLRQMGIPLHMYINENGLYPPSRVDPPKTVRHFSSILTTIMTGEPATFDGDGMMLGHNSEIFECPDARLPNIGPMKRFCHYSAHQRIMPAYINDEDTGDIGWTGPFHKPHKASGASEKILIADGPQSHSTEDRINAGNASPSFWKTIYPLPTKEVRLSTLNDPIDESGNLNTDHNANRGYFRYRHMHDTAVNVLFVDGHAGPMKRGTILNRNIRSTRDDDP